MSMNMRWLRESRVLFSNYNALFRHASSHASIMFASLSKALLKSLEYPATYRGSLNPMDCPANTWNNSRPKIIAKQDVIS